MTDPIIPSPGSHRRGVVGVRLAGPPDVMDAALTTLADMFGEAWQMDARYPSRTGSGHGLVYGKLIVPVPTEAPPPPADYSGAAR